MLAWGPEAIQAYCKTLTRDLLREARDMGFVIEDEALRSAHLFGVRVPEHLSRDRLREALARRNVSVSVRGDALRISPHVYNDAADVDALRDALHTSLQPAPPVHSTPS